MFHYCQSLSQAWKNIKACYENCTLQIHNFRRFKLQDPFNVLVKKSCACNAMAVHVHSLVMYTLISMHTMISCFSLLSVLTLWLVFPADCITKNHRFTVYRKLTNYVVSQIVSSLSVTFTSLDKHESLLWHMYITNPYFL